MIGDVGFPTPVSDMLSAEHARRIAVALDRDDDVDAGCALPLLWHWAFFTPTAPTATLGSDGHPTMEKAWPTVDLPRRMWAGGRIHTHGDLVIGQRATRRSRLLRSERKTGRTGELLVVTVVHEIDQSDRLVLTEEQDLVYRGRTGALVTPEVGEHVPVPIGGWCDDVMMSSVTLFRYSAVTFNGHRIHYDHPYATSAEGYPGLVVQGPLTATVLAGSAIRRDRTGATFEFRATAPLFAETRFTLVGEPNGDATELRAIRNDGVVAMTARLS